MKIILLWNDANDATFYTKLLMSLPDKSLI